MDWKLEIGNWKFYVIYLLYAIFGLLPSVIWLLFYLRKDHHPEPNRMVIKIFLWGMMMGPLAILLELSVKWLLNPADLTSFIDILKQNSRDIYLFVGIVVVAPIIEEIVKYAVVRFAVLKNPEFDEPLDIMLYMIISALGFAAIENLLLVFQNPLIPFGQVVSLAALRFVSATFLHALSSGLLGYWLARSLAEPAKKFQFLARGFGLAIFFHASYNYLTWVISDSQCSSTNGICFGSAAAAAMTLILLGFMAVAVSYNFSILKKLHSVCKICKPRPDFWS
jgi:RsiW-degrading membrane proteinase PrsW (M82 family)